MIRIKKQSQLSKCILLMGCSLTASVFAADFYTIIGPDGRPMVVQENAEKKAKNLKPPKSAPVEDEIKLTKSQLQTVEVYPRNELSSPSQTDQSAVLKKPEQPQSTVKTKSPGLPKKDSEQIDLKVLKEIQSSNVLESKDTSVQSQPKTDLDQYASKSKAQLLQPPAQVIPPSTKDSSQASIPTSPIQKAPEIQPQIAEEGNKPSNTVRMEASTPSSVQVTPPKQTQKPQNITQIDGVDYVDNEFLESKEFNLEGRKRFYVMPDANVAGATGRFETVEREKGITKSVLSKFLNQTPKQSAPVVLASTYYRLPKEQVVETLEQACFQGKKINKAKELSQKNLEIGFWPVPPLKEKFVYDVVKLDASVQNIHFSSYASSQKNPSYYWPLVVFLDQQGCVIEGVSGFKNQDTQANHLQYSALEGVLKKPNTAMYLFMTPLAESIDVQHVQLSNQGQIKLSVLR